MQDNQYRIKSPTEIVYNLRGGFVHLKTTETILPALTNSGNLQVRKHPLQSSQQSY